MKTKKMTKEDFNDPLFAKLKAKYYYRYMPNTAWKKAQQEFLTIKQRG